MILLAVETSGHEGSIAILADGADADRMRAPVSADGLDNELASVAESAGVVIIEQRLQTSGRRHAQTLVGDAGELLQRYGIDPAEINAVAVSIGPGSFTGLRIGLTFAKTFAWANHALLTAVDTLQAIAQRAPRAIPVVTAIIDAQRGELFAAEYTWNPDAAVRERAGAIQVRTVAELDPEFPLSGPVLLKRGTELSAQFQMLSEELWSPTAAVIAELGHRQILAGVTCDGTLLEPVYIRRSYAEEKPR